MSATATTHSHEPLRVDLSRPRERPSPQPKRQPTDRLRVAIVGLGERAAWMASLIRKADTHVEVAAVVDPDPSKARERAGKASLELTDSTAWFESIDALLDDDRPLDGIVIGTRCNLHTPLAVRLAKHSAALFLEKPVAISWSQYRELRAAMQHRTDDVVVSFPLRRTPLFEAAKHIVDSGRLGTLSQIQAFNNVPYGAVYVDTWYRDYDLDGGLWLQKATHDFDYLHALADSAPVAVMAMHSRQVWQAPVKHQDAGSAILRYASGLHTSYVQNFIARRKAGARGATLIGEKATLTFDWYTNVIRVVEHEHDRVDEIKIDADSAGHGGGDGRLAQNFVDVMRGRSASLTPIVDGLLSVATCLAARDSAATGQLTHIPTTGEPRPGVDRSALRPDIEPPTDL
ncbi:MAG: Gfo/Idh/MocA family oxidoreductase [Tepidisphaeraceae bacterium]